MKKIIFIFAIGLILYGCTEKPVDADRSGNFQFLVVDTSGYLDKDPGTGLALLKNGSVKFTSATYNVAYEFKTNDNGIVYATNLPASNYTVSVNIMINDNYSIFGSKERPIYGSIKPFDTLFLKSAPASAIIINEIYFCGCVNNKNYFWDLYVELYNNTDEIKYLDGLIISRTSEGPAEKNGLAIYDMGDNVFAVKVASAFQFPGTAGGKQYPIYPRQIVVVAGDAIDHRINYPTSIDLSPKNPVFKNGDPNYSQLWEFYNVNASDIDIAGVPNVTNMLAKTTSDFLVSLTYDAVILYSGKKGIIYSGEDTYIDLSTVLDGVAYNGGSSTKRKLDGRIDAGVCGIEIGAYSGKSVERRVVDKNNPKQHYDTNNSTVDFGVNQTPTPGYQGDPK
jgi:hypothetical protein